MTRLSSALPSIVAAICLSTVTATASHIPAPVNPTYLTTFSDAVTGDPAPSRTSPAVGNGGQFTNADGTTIQWDIDQNNPDGSRADNYSAEQYERPTDQTFSVVTSNMAEQRFGLGFPGAGVQYYGYLDILEAKAGFDSNWLYVSIDLFSLNRVNNSGSVNQQGLEDIYRFRIGKGPAGAESRNGFLVGIQNPTANAGTSFAINSKAEVFADQSSGIGGVSPGDVGGVSLGLTKETSPGEVAGNGYDVQVVADGRTNGSGGYANNQDVLYTRINPSDPTIVEFAWDYKFFGFSEADLRNQNLFLMFESTKGLTGPSNYFWNDEYNYGEAGTPNFDERGLAGPNSSFQTTGLQNIYQLDTLRGVGGIPEPSTSVLLLIGISAGIARLRDRKRGQVSFFLGRPRGRSADCRSSRLAERFTHTSLP
jgi:hypothetical protein